MDQKAPVRNITAIIPAYNEVERIAGVLDVVASYHRFSEVLVIDDASTDETEAIVAQYPVQYFRNSTNMGKAFCMDKAIAMAKSDILFFCDADIHGLTHGIIDEMIQPVEDDEVEMFIAMRNRSWYVLRRIFSFVPLFGGERVIRRSLWEKLPTFYKQRFRIEAGLNFYAKYYGKGFGMKLFRSLSQVSKEKKYGFFRGFKQRLGMMSDIVIAEARLQFIDIPQTIQNIRFTAGALITSAIAVIIGVFVIIASRVGPQTFILQMFQNELAQDPAAPFVHFLLNIADIVNDDLLLIAGWIIAGVNFLVIIFGIRRLLKLIRRCGFSVQELLTKEKSIVHSASKEEKPNS